MKSTDILREYTAGELTLEEANAALREMGSDLTLDPEKNTLTQDELEETRIGYYARHANGWGLLDTGTGTLDKVEVREGRLVDCDCGGMYALCIIAGRMFEVKGTALQDDEKSEGKV